MTFRDIYHKFRDITSRREEADRKLLELMGHKDFKTHVQMEDVYRINEVIAEYHAQMCTIVTTLRAKYPRSRYGMPMPWERPEFDRYHQQTEPTEEVQNS